MIIASAQDVHFSIGGRSILNGLNWEIHEHARIGLVGSNGAGKSTLLRLLAGFETPTAGHISTRRGLRIAYLSQHIVGDQRTPLQTVMAARPDLTELEAQIQACENQLGEPAIANDLQRMNQVLERHSRLLNQFEELGGSMLYNDARGYLQQFGFDGNDLSLPTNSLSGGQRKMIGLASCLIQRPDLLLLDEPETHLDLNRREFLETTIREFAGAVVIVAHDRYLLDETISSVVHLEAGRTSLWLGNYSTYAVNRQLALQRQQQDFIAQQKEINRLEEAIKRFQLWASLVPNERHIKQARVKQMQIDKMDKVEKPVLERRKVGLSLRSEQRGGQKIIDLRDVSMSFGDDLVLLGIEQTIWRGERVGIVGQNGAGKSVLGKLMHGQFEPSDGMVWVGPSIEIGYFAQGVETLDHSQTPIDVVRLTRSMYEGQAVACLGGFLFSYAQCRQSIGSLSGGERARLQLALLMLAKPNCLILDEPTNHLDIDSVEVLEDALERYDGTVIVISHDRYFLDRVVDRVWAVNDGSIKPHLGGYSAWREASKAPPAPVIEPVVVKAKAKVKR